MLMVAAPFSAATFATLPLGQLTVYTPVASGTENLPPSSTLMSATFASPLNTGSTVPALTPVTVPCRTPTCAWAPAASNNPATMDNVFSFFMSALRYRVARRLAGDGALYWRRREFGYPSQSCVDRTNPLTATHWPRSFRPPASGQ